MLDTGSEKLALEIESVRFFKQFAIVKFKGCDDISHVEKYKGKSLLVTRENAVALEEGEYFIADLIGIQAISQDGALKGRVKDVITTGANDVYEILLEDGRVLLLPAIKECVLGVDLEEGVMKIRLLEGLLE